MKMAVSILIGLLVLLSAVAAEEAAPELPDLDAEAQEYEAAETGDAVIAEIEASLETDEDIENELGITEEEKAEIDEASAKIGLKQHVLNRQLKQRAFVRIIHGEAIVLFMQNKGIDTAELESVLEELRTIYKGIEPKTMTKEEFNSTLEELKAKVQEFKEKAAALVPEGDLPAIKNRMQAYEREKSQDMESLRIRELKARQLYNKKQFAEAVQRLNKDAKELRQDNKKLLGVAERLRAINALREQYQNTNPTKSDVLQLKERWGEEVKNFRAEKDNAVVKNERAQLAVSAARIRKAAKDAEKSGEDTTDLDSKLGELNAQIKGLVPGKVTAENVKAKAATIRARISKVEKDKRIAGRIAPKAAAKREADAGTASTGDAQ